MMDNPDEPEDGGTILEKDMFGLPSPSSSFGSSLGASHDFRRMFKPPNKKKYEEEMDKVIQEIKSKEAEMKSLGVRPNDVVTSDLEGIRAEKDANISKRKKVDAELKQLNLNIQKLRGSLSTTESNLHYKNEAKIDEAIRKLEWQLKVQNFKVSEERRIVAEIDKLKRSKKVLVQYFTQKRELDDTKARQSRLRGEREHYYKSVTMLKTREDDIRRTRNFNKTRGEELKKEIDELYNNKRKLFADFKQHESEYYRLQKEHKKAQRKESFKKREEDRRAKEMAYRKEMLEFEAQKEPFEDEKNLCNTLMSYLQRYVTTSGEETSLASPREEHPDPPIGAGPGVADSLDDGMFVLLKKSDEGERDYSISNKRPNSKRGRKGRKQSVTKPLAHTPQIIAQFASLNLNAPSNMSEVGASVEQLQARKRYYDEHAAKVPRPILGSISGSFSSSGSMSSMESPLRERSSTWGFVEVPPAIAENQTPSDCGRSAESGFHDMSRQASKTESSESAAECQPCDHALDELIRQSAEYGESEHSRSSSDTVTPEDHVTEEPDQSLGATGGHCVSSENSPVSADGSYKTMNQSESHDSHKNWPIAHDSDSAVFELGLTSEELLTGNNSCDSSFNTPNTYDLDFPETLNTMTIEKFPTFLDPIPQSFNHSVSNSENANEVTRTDSHNIDCVQNNEKKLGDNETLVDGCITDLTESSCKDDKSFHSGEPKMQETHKSATLNYSETESICETQRQKSPNILLENDFINSNLEKIVFVKDNGSEIDTSLKCDKQDTCDKSPSADNIQHCDHDREGLGSNIGGFKSSLQGLEPSIGVDASIGAELIAGAGLDCSNEAGLIDIAGVGLDGSIEAGLKDIAGVGLDGSREATGIDIVECDQAGACMNENTRL